MIAGDIDFERAVWDPDYRRDVMRFLEEEAQAEAVAASRQAAPGRAPVPPRRLAVAESRGS